MLIRKPIPGWEDRYEAGSDGHVYSLKTGRPIFEEKNVRHDRRFQVKMWRNQKVTTVQVQRLVCLAWHGPRPEGKEVSHLNGDSLDNRPENLKWETKKENTARKVEHGTSDKGLLNTRSSFTEETLGQVRQAIDLGWSYDYISRQFGISKTTISRVKTGSRYAK